MDALSTLGLSAVIWFAIHALISGSELRSRLVSRLGEPGFRGLFALLSVLSLWFLVSAYRSAPCVPLWLVPMPLLWLPAFVMPLAFLLLAGAFSVPNPTAVGAERILEREAPARGVLRITRHPFLWAVSLWSGAHVLANGSLASLAFFGSMLLTSLHGTRDIDRKRARSAKEAWARYVAVTSNVPFAAIIAGRNQLVFKELWLAIAIGSVLTALALAFHETLFRVAPLPVTR
jgi:uncharacterized membrane protein